MKIEDLLSSQIRNLDTAPPQFALLVKQLLEYWANLKDNEINNQLLGELVFKYAAAERQLKRLNQELFEKQKRLDEDLTAAAGIQQSLLPQKIAAGEKLEIAWRFEPCEHMGGDILNLFQLDNDHWGFYVLDVSGHGVPAAMITVSVSQFLEPSSGNLVHRPAGAQSEYEIVKPSAVLAALDKEFPFERFDNFFTISYLIVNTRTGSLKYSSAGHPPSIVLRRDGKLELLSKAGPAIGTLSMRPADMIENAFKEADVQIYPGDKVFICSDGIAEYQNGDGKLFGNENFHEKLREYHREPVSDIVANVFTSLMEFGNNLKPQDDITLLGLELKRAEPGSG